MAGEPNRFFDDIAKFITHAAHATKGAGHEVKVALQDRFDKMFNSLNIVRREEFEAFKEMLLKIHDKNLKLEARLKDLETGIRKDSEKKKQPLKNAVRKEANSEKSKT